MVCEVSFVNVYFDDLDALKDAAEKAGYEIKWMDDTELQIRGVYDHAYYSDATGKIEYTGGDSYFARKLDRELRAGYQAAKVQREMKADGLRLETETVKKDGTLEFVFTGDLS